MPVAQEAGLWTAEKLLRDTLATAIDRGEVSERILSRLNQDIIEMRRSLFDHGIREGRRLEGAAAADLAAERARELHNRSAYVFAREEGC